MSSLVYNDVIKSKYIFLWLLNSLNNSQKIKSKKDWNTQYRHLINVCFVLLTLNTFSFLICTLKTKNIRLLCSHVMRNKIVIPNSAEARQSKTVLVLSQTLAAGRRGITKSRQQQNESSRVFWRGKISIDAMRQTFKSRKCNCRKLGTAKVRKKNK